MADDAGDSGMVPLRQMLGVLRAELTASMEDAKGAALRFRLEEVELELQVAVTATGGGNAGVEFWVVSLGARGERTSGSTHTFKLKLKPATPDARDVLVGDSAGTSFLGRGKPEAATPGPDSGAANR